MNSTARNRRRIALLKAKETALKGLLSDLAEMREDLISEGDMDGAEKIADIVGRATAK